MFMYYEITHSETLQKLPYFCNTNFFVLLLYFFFQTDSHVWRGCGSASWNDNIFYVVHLYANSRDFYDILKQIIM